MLVAMIHRLGHHKKLISDLVNEELESIILLGSQSTIYDYDSLASKLEVLLQWTGPLTKGLLNSL